MEPKAAKRRLAVVPIYYLHLCNGAGFTEDVDGQEFSDPEAARTAAVEGLRGVLAGDLLSGEINTASFIEIQDDAHELVGIVHFRDAIQVVTEASCDPRS